MNQKRMEKQRRTFQHIPNPYTAGAPLKPDNPTFVGREDIFRFIRQHISVLAQKAVLLLIGERRTGKTSILKQLPTRLQDPGYIPIYIDGQALGIDPGLENFFLSIVTAIADGLEEAGISIPRLTLAEIKENPRYAFEQHFLPRVRERIGDRTLLFAMDEFEELGYRVEAGRLPEEVFFYLRHMIQHEEQMAFIFVGTHMMEELIGDYWSVLFNVARYRKVTFLNREEAVRLITEPVRPYGMVYDDSAIDEVLRVTGCHPYFTQLLCSILVERCNDAHRNYVTVQNIRDTVEELLETSRAHLMFVWQTSNREDRVVLSVLAELQEQSDQVTVAAIAKSLSDRRLRLDPELIVQVAERLIGRDLLRGLPGDPPTCGFTAQLYAHWLRNYKSFSKVLKEAITEEEWKRAKALIEDSLFTTGFATMDQLTNIAEPDRQFAWSRYLDTYRSEFDFAEAPLIRLRNQKGLNLLNEVWQRMVAAVTSEGPMEDVFDRCAQEIVDQLRLVSLQELVSEPLPRHPRLLTFLLDTKVAFEDTKLPPSVPLIFVRRLAIEEGDVTEIRRLLHKQLSPSRNLAFAVVCDRLVSLQRAEDLLREKLAPYACDVVLLGLRELQHLIVALEPQTALRRLVLSKVNLISISPFITTGATSDNVFFGREPELREIYQHIATVSYAIIGGRRIGKTSLLGHLYRIRLPAAGFRAIYHDCSSTLTYTDFLAAVIGNWRPEPPRDAPVTLGDLLQSSPSDKPLVLLLDEADKLVPIERSHNWPIFNSLRALANAGRAQIVLSGERTLREAIQDPASPLFNFANEMLLGPLDFRAVEELVTRPMKQLEIELVGKSMIVRDIYDSTSGHPNVVQRLCHRLIQRLNEQGTRRIIPEDVEAVIKNVDFIREDFLGTFFSRASTLEHLCALLMAANANLRTLTSVHESLIQRGVDATLNQVDAALERLVDLRGILDRTPEGYDFAVTAFPRIISKSRRLSDWIALRREVFAHAGDIPPETAPPELQGRLW